MAPVDAPPKCREVAQGTREMLEELVSYRAKAAERAQKKPELVCNETREPVPTRVLRTRPRASGNSTISCYRHLIQCSGRTAVKTAFDVQAMEMLQHNKVKEVLSTPQVTPEQSSHVICEL